MISHNVKRLYLAGLFWLGFLVLSPAQNLVPNPSFETFTSCPNALGALCNGIATPWQCGTSGSCDYYNACANPSWFGVPDNLLGSQTAHTGEAYAGAIYHWPSFPNYREYLLIQLTEPLVADTWYQLNFYVSLAELACGIEKIGAYFSVTSPYQNINTVLNVVPQIETHYGFITDAVNWVLISGCYQAEGGEEFLTIGNFHNDMETPVDPSCFSDTTYYYIDDVSVMETIAPDEFAIDLGGPLTVCFSYEIDPGLSDFFFIWSNGSHGPTLVVTETGTYSLTVTDGCNFGTGEIDITVLGNADPIDIGPDELTICIGDVYEVELDPDLSQYTWNDGSNDSDYSISTSGVYSVTLDDGCAVLSDEITVTVLDPPSPFDLGDDFTLCVGYDFDFNFDPDLGDFLWQDGSNSPSVTISEGGLYALTISNMCGEEIDEIVVTDLDIPEIELGNDDQVLCNGDILEIEIDPSLGEILWQDGSDQPNYEITTSGIYTVFVTNSCGTASDQINVTVYDNPVFDLGGDIHLCDGDSLLLDGDGIVGNYLWQDNSTSSQFLVTSPGTYALTISNACAIGVDTIVVDYSVPLIPPDFGPDVSLCPGESFVLHAASPGASYLWQDTTTLDSFVVSTSGTYHVQVYNVCNSFTDTIVVTVNDNPPQIDLPAQLSLCQGQSITLDAMIGGVAYLWNDNSLNQQLTVAAPGVYSLTVTNACGTDVDTTIIIDGGLAPAVELGNDIDLCPGETIVLSPVYANVNTWLWNDGSSLDSLVVSGASLVFVEVINSCGSAYDTLNTNLLPATPPLDLGVDTSLCSGQSFILSINTPGVSVIWPDGSTGPDFNVSSPGLVFASIANSCGQASDTILVSALPDIPLLNLGPDQSLCPGEIISLSPGIANVSYEWHDGSTNNTYQSTQEETIILTITNDCGTTSDTLEVFESTNGPQVDLGPDILACNGDIITIPSGISGVNYLWQDGSTSPDFVTSVSNTLILQVSNLCGTDADTLVIDIHGVPPTPQLGTDTTLCEGISLVLTSTADTETSIAWQDGSSQSTFNVSTPGMYSLHESNHCGNAGDTIVVAYIDAPDDFTLGTDTILCPGESIVLTAPLTTYELEWQDGSTQNNIVADTAITYSLQISNECGTQSDSLSVNIDNRTLAVDLDPSISWCEGDIITLDATQPFNVTYHWSSGETTPVIQVTSPGVYAIDVSAPCSDLSQTVDVIPGTDCFVAEIHNDVFIPNVFSPNGDNINDVFTVSYGPDLNVTGMEGSIFDRWGNLVYSSKENPFSWDGLYAGEILQPGVFVYIIKMVYLDMGTEREIVFSGDITLIR